MTIRKRCLDKFYQLRTTLATFFRAMWAIVLTTVLQTAHKISALKIAVHMRIRVLWTNVYASGSALALRTRLAIIQFRRRNQRTLDFIIYIVLAFALAESLSVLWRRLDDYIGDISNSVLPALAIGVGAGITGMIAIVFSLSLFAIQQVADKAAPEILREYAHDRLLALYFFVLAALATMSFAVALIKSDRDYRTTVTVCLLSMLVMSFCLLRVHFRRITQFVDPRYTILRIRLRGIKQIQKLNKIVGKVIRASQPAIRHS
jgi:hypothetical protein